MDSILTSIKIMLGITKECTDFDSQIIMHINSVFMILNQLGVGPSDCFRIEDDLAIWSDFIKDEKNLESVKTYMYLKVKLIFDPPLSSAVKDATNQMIKELEWRLNFDTELK